MLLLLTSSGDGTSDRIVERLGDQVFRYNFDQVQEFKACLGADSWEIINPVGHVISSTKARAVFWWKAFALNSEDVDKMILSERKYVFTEFYNWFEDNGVIKGNSARFHDRFGKIRILSKAKQYFKIPETIYSYGLLGESMVPHGNRVTKSLSSALTSDGMALFTTDVSGKNLSPEYPWFLQEKISSMFDITCALVGTKIFSFARGRANLKGLDWRSEQNFDENIEEWTPFKLSADSTDLLLQLSADIGVEWGRYDFMLNDSDELVFLEFNANGQFVFLDYHDKFGIMDAVVSYLRS